MAKIVLENGDSYHFNKTCSLNDNILTIDGEKINTDSKETIKRHKIYSGLLTPDGTLLSSVNRHDYVTHEDKNGKHYMLDGGTDYIRCSVNGDEKFISVFLDEPIEKTREVTARSGYGAPDEPDYGTRWRCARLCEMSDQWVEASIDYVGHELLKKQYQDELDYRKENNIIIKDNGQQYHPDWGTCWSNIDLSKIL